MIKVFCGRRGTGKTKKLLGIANEGIKDSKGDLVYIDVNNKNTPYLNSEIRFINTNELNAKGTEGIYGLICGIISQNYDVEKIYIDNLNMMIDFSLPNAKNIFKKLEEFSNKFDVNIFINVDCEECTELNNYLEECSIA